MSVRSQQREVVCYDAGVGCSGQNSGRSKRNRLDGVPQIQQYIK